MKNRKSTPGSGEPGSYARKKRKKHRPLSFSAMETNDLAMLRMLLAKNPDLAHERDLNGMTLLRTAVFQAFQVSESQFFGDYVEPFRLDRQPA